ncbi:MAG: hypothetical protein ABI835_04355 [Chloroflexota bacterium]
MDSGVSDFVRQIPQGFVLMFCGSGVLLAVVLVYIVRERNKRANRAVPAVTTEFDYPDYEETSADLPDLDILASGEMVSQSFAQVRSAGAHTVALEGGENVEVVEVLTVLRDVGEGGLIIQIGEKAYRNPPAYADVDFKRRLHTTLRDLNSVQLSVGVPEPMPVDPVAAEFEAPLQTPPPAPSMSASQEFARLNPYEPAPGDLPKFRMPDGPPVRPKRGQRPIKEAIPEINIAASIEAFLQHKLVVTALYRGHSIHVVPAAHGAVRIEVDGMFYESVAEVKDVAVRQFIAATIEEWQARQ